MPERTGRGDPIILGAADMAEVERITSRIMEGIGLVDRIDPSPFRNHVIAVLASEISAANLEYERTLAAEEVHAEGFHNARPVLAHLASECSLDFCGRYRGQRRDSQEPPAIPGTPTGYCARCARSGVGACDDFPNCPGGRGVSQ